MGRKKAVAEVKKKRGRPPGKKSEVTKKRAYRRRAEKIEEKPKRNYSRRTEKVEKADDNFETVMPQIRKIRLSLSDLTFSFSGNRPVNVRITENYYFTVPGGWLEKEGFDPDDTYVKVAYSGAMRQLILILRRGPTEGFKYLHKNGIGVKGLLMLAGDPPEWIGHLREEKVQIEGIGEAWLFDKPLLRVKASSEEDFEQIEDEAEAYV